MSGVIDIINYYFLEVVFSSRLSSGRWWKHNMYMTMRTIFVENEEDRKTDFLLKVMLLTTDSQLLLSIAG